MKLSIITINFNNIEGLQKTIESVQCQTWKDFEWIFIDGGSTDGSKELIEKTAAEYPNVSYWCSEPDKGVYNAQNKGIAHANGEYLNFMNSGDTFYDKNVLMNVWRENHDEDVLYGDWLWCSDSMTKLANCPHEITIGTMYYGNICHQAMFIKSQLLKEEAFDESFKIYADWARWMKMAYENRSFKYLPYIICRFQMGGLSGTNPELTKLELQRIRETPSKPLEKLLEQFCDQKWKLDRYEYFPFSNDVLELIEERPLFRRIVRIIIIILQGLKKWLDILHI